MKIIKFPSKNIDFYESNIYVHPDQCFPRYRFFLCCFGVVGVLLTVLELKEQAWSRRA